MYRSPPLTVPSIRRTSLVLNPESNLTVDLVAKSMAHFQLLSHDRQRVDIVYPSEPTLAAGATQYLKLSGHIALQELHQMLLNKQVSIGDLGEFAAEILARSAIDGVLDEPYLNSITVEQFVKCFFTPEAFQELLALNPSNLRFCARPEHLRQALVMNYFILNIPNK